MKRFNLLAMLVTVGALSITVGAWQGRGRQGQPQRREAVIEKVRDNLYVFTSAGAARDNVTLFITENNGVVMVDSGSAGWGQIWLDKLKTVTNKPITTLISTHNHADHTGSIPEMGGPFVRVAQENAKILMAQAACVPLTSCQLFQGENAKFLPNRTFKDRLTLFSGKDQIELYHFGRAHTSGDAMLVYPALGVANTGDLFPWRGVPRVMTDDFGSVLEFPKTLARVTSTVKNIDTYITGHSKVMALKDLVDYRNYVTDYVAYVTAMHKAGKSVDEAMAGLPHELAKYKVCDPKETLATELQKIDCVYRTDQAKLDAEILYDELEGRLSTAGSAGKSR